MTYAELDLRFLTKFDLYSPYFNESQRSEIYTEALRRIVEREWEQYETTGKASENLSGLIARYVGAPTTSSSHTKPGTFKYLVSLKCKYTSNGTTYYKKAVPIRANESENVFAQPSTRFPKFRIRDNTIYLEPSGVTEITLEYLEEPDPIDIENNPADEPKIPLKMQDKLLEEAIVVAAEITREDGAYARAKQEVRDNP